MDCWAIGVWIGLTGCAYAGESVAIGQLDPAVDESSGLEASVRWPGVYWTLNDSGDQPRLFAVTGEGRLLRSVPVEGATNVDWEDLTQDEAGHLWIADTGNNGNRRQDLTLYRVPEPDPGGSGAVRVDRVIHVRYPEQRLFPDPAARNFDAESLFWADGTLWLLTKHRSDLQTTLYRVPALEGSVALERVSTFDLGGDPDNHGGSATSADLDASGRWLALLTYHALFVFERPADGRQWLGQVVHRVDFDQRVTRQCEGVVWDAGEVVFTNEAGQVFRVTDPLSAARFPTGAP